MAAAADRVAVDASSTRAKYHDEYRERVLELIEKKAAGEEIAVQPEAEEPEAAPDLMAALEASLAALKDDGDDGAAKKPAASKPKPRKRAGSDGDGDGDGAKPKKSRTKAKA